MDWVKNTKKEKPKIDEKYEDKGFSVQVIIHLKLGTTFLLMLKHNANYIGYWDYNENIWIVDGMKINDDEVLFWLNIPKLPSLA